MDKYIFLPLMNLSNIKKMKIPFKLYRLICAIVYKSSRLYGKKIAD